ncbi:efflux transporter outer membrane subunit [Ideonella alba]|uniref:Efflux transporter outer membrane subunit n=1 Tax=Ideonella alba TaxID=2824118 RepID=A0A940YDF1_9BURK|nr:efflux transporter outer membrane subunit [Ideonella alba]MBQ0931106.1 efflux transporter outer membrane subunit [Ideonella alba]
MRRLITPLAASLLLAGCVHLAPDYQRPAAPVPDALPVAGDVTQAHWPSTVELLRDARLRQVVELALAGNRDLRVALLNVEKSRAQLRIADADRWPTLSAALIASRAPNNQGVQANSWQGGLQLSSYEIDLLGRVRDASDAAAASLLATEAAARAARLALVTQTATAWLTLAADTEQLRLVRATLVSREESLRLTVLRERVGAASALELRAAEGLAASARAAVAQLERQQAQDRNALALLVGQPLTAAQLPPEDVSLAGADWLAPVPAGMSSQVLLARPDVIQAEQQLVAANANIGVARGAMFPRLVISGSAGQVSDTLAGLFDGGRFAYSLTSTLAMALFDAGRNQANVRVAEVNREQAVASYEKTVQGAYREAADALVAQSTWTRQVQAQQTLLSAEQERTRLTRLRFEVGAASLVDTLDAERSLAAAQQALVQVRLAEALNRLVLYKALGGAERAGA